MFRSTCTKRAPRLGSATFNQKVAPQPGQDLHLLGAFMEQAGQAFIGAAGRFFGDAAMATRSRRHGPLLNGTGASTERVGPSDCCDDALRRFVGGAAMASTAGASAGRPFWQSTHLHAATHLTPSRKQSQWRLRQRLVLQVQPSRDGGSPAIAARASRNAAEPATFSQFSHLHESPHSTPRSKHRQYLLRHLEFLQRQKDPCFASKAAHASLYRSRFGSSRASR